MTIHQQDLSPSSPTETVSGMAISLAFWLCLLFAATLFAGISLAPKYAVYLRLRNQFESNQSKLVANENQVERLKRVIDAMRNDREFAAELTRVEFDATRPDEEVIPVESPLKLAVLAIERPIPKRVDSRVWYEPVVSYLASDRKLRDRLLAATGLLVIVAFTLLQPAGAARVSSGVRQCHSICQGLRNRYSGR